MPMSEEAVARRVALQLMGGRIPIECDYQDRETVAIAVLVEPGPIREDTFVTVEFGREDNGYRWRYPYRVASLRGFARTRPGELFVLWRAIWDALEPYVEDAHG